MGMASLHFVGGTLELRGVSSELGGLPGDCAWDPRSACFRAPASRYAPLVLALRALGVEYEDQARAYRELDFGLRVQRVARPFQSEALAALRQAQGRGLVVLPTGAGKSHLAVMAIDHWRRSTLVVAPTLALVQQWYDLLRASFGVEVGVVGGGEYSVHALTVTTYDSAYLHMENLGGRFGFVVFDECHHLPAEAYALAARQCLAPFRLGLTATLERADGREALLAELVGPVVYRKEIVELSGEYLSDYETEQITISLSPAERSEYEAERGVYLAFLRSQGIRMNGPQGWLDFVRRSSRGAAGRRAMAAYRRQRELAVAAPAKLDYLELLIESHGSDLMLVFTQDNATAYEISRRFLVPVITHQTKVSERSEILERFAARKYGVVVTSKVLNEGVDVPEANVAVVISGSASVREHVQRLGRILRRREGKRARLYELVSKGTAETFTSERRRDHDAYR
ncbi:MAG TPA: DEAD/DEAH box helicase family protein [Polyangiaceae bacterium]|nr:DEAD/DEAH box helicase family protein [Polyangiaceae bacterium]